MTLRKRRKLLSLSSLNLASRKRTYKNSTFKILMTALCALTVSGRKY
jgi:hypothetical protein